MQMIELANHKCICSEKCLINTTQTAIPVKHAKSSYIIVNSEEKKVSKYIVDDCVLKNVADESKCDYIFTWQKNICFVELKGGDVQKAIKQIRNTLEQILVQKDFTKLARIIPSKSPSPNYYTSELKKLNKRLAAPAIIKNIKMQEII